MPKRLTRVLLVLLLAIAVPVQGIATAGGDCEAHHGAPKASLGHDSTTQFPGHVDGDPLDTHCVGGTAISSPLCALAAVQTTGGVDPVIVVRMSGFVPEGPDRPPLSQHS